MELLIGALATFRSQMNVAKNVPMNTAATMIFSLSVNVPFTHSAKKIAVTDCL